MNKERQTVNRGLRKVLLLNKESCSYKGYKDIRGSEIYKQNKGINKKNKGFNAWFCKDIKLNFTPTLWVSS